MKQISQTRLACVLTVTLLGLSYSLFETTRPADDRDAQLQSLTPSKRPAIPLYQEPQHPALSDLRETVTRPLFRATRRVPVVREAAKEAAPINERSYELVGVTVFGKRRIALIRALGGSQVRRVSEGQRFDRWRVLRIEPRWITLARGEELLELRLKDDARSQARSENMATKAEAEVAPTSAPAALAADLQNTTQ